MSKTTRRDCNKKSSTTVINKFLIKNILSNQMMMKKIQMFIKSQWLPIIHLLSPAIELFRHITKWIKG